MKLSDVIKIAKEHYAAIPAGKQRQAIMRGYRYDYHKQKKRRRNNFFYAWYYITYIAPKNVPILYLELSYTDGDVFDTFKINHETLIDDPQVSFWSISPLRLNGEDRVFVSFKYKRFATALEKQLILHLKSGNAPSEPFTFNSEELIKALALSLYALRNKK